MAISLSTLMEEAKCLCAANASDAQKATLALLQRIAEATAGQPLVYRALLTQTGTNAPVATVLENTLGGTVVWSRTSSGRYVGTLASAFPANKTWNQLFSSSEDVEGSSSSPWDFRFQRTSDNTLDWQVGQAGSHQDYGDVFGAGIVFIEVLVYP